MSRSNRKTIDQVLVLLGLVTTIVLVVVGGLSFYAYNFATNQVRTELIAQKIFFPEKGSANFSAEDYPGLQQYAGEQVDDGPKAKAYANEYIGKHLEKVAGGKTYSEVSAEAMKNPTDAKLQQQKQTLFQGETLRGILLGTGYAYWTFGMIAYYAALAAFAGAAVMGVLVLLGLRHIKK